MSLNLVQSAATDPPHSGHLSVHFPAVVVLDKSYLIDIFAESRVDTAVRQVIVVKLLFSLGLDFVGLGKIPARGEAASELCRNLDIRRQLKP